MSSIHINKPSQRSVHTKESEARSERGYLAALGDRVREARARRGMSRKLLARDSEVSERYLAQLEAGHGNVSILLLRQIATALNLSLTELLAEDSGDAVELTLTTQFLKRDRKSTRLNSSHANISYAVFCLNKKNRDLGDLVCWRQALELQRTS